MDSAEDSAARETEQFVLAEDAGSGVRVLVLNRPDKLNAFTTAMILHLLALLEAAVEDPAVRVIVLRANGRAFCAGGDLDEMISRATRDGVGRKNNVWQGIERIPLLLERSDKPMIAAVQGAARGAGVDLSLMCDIRIAAQSAEFAETYVNMGLVAGAGGSWFLPRVVGAARALEMFWTARTVQAEEAERIGLVSRVVPDDALEQTTLELARKIASQPVESVRFFRRAVYQGLTTSLYPHLDMISSHMSVLRDSPEHLGLLEKVRQRLGTSKA
jgi:enoyl-CoA hydratase/carnithine racemase